MGAVIMQVVGLVILLTIDVLFFSKQKIKTDETKIYSRLLFLATLFVILGIIVYMVAIKTYNLSYIALVQRVYLIVFILLNHYCIKYCICLFDNIKNSDTIKGIIISITSVAIILTILLPLKAIFDGEYLSGEGAAYELSVIYTVITGVFFMIITIVFILQKRRLKKILPFITFVLIYLLGLLINKYYKDSIILEGFFFSYVLLIMYHTIENPDLKMLEQFNDNRELAELNIEDKSNLLFQISQEVSSPIRKIKILSGSILKSDNLDEIRNNVGNIYDLTNGLSNTVDNILDITSMDKNNIRVYDTSYNIFNLFTQIVYMIKNRINNSVDFKYNINSFIPELLYGDSIKLKQIICALLINCIEHADEGTIDLDISAIVKQDICRLIITVSDNGSGMSLQKINNVLSSEDVADEKINVSDNYDVDLKTIKKTINLLGGNLLIKSYDKEGTSFTIVLDQLIDNTKKVESDIPDIKNISNKQKVLLVDDDYKELELLSKEFKRNNFVVSSTMYGKDCVDKIKNNESYDLIFIDDEMEGYNAVKTITSLNSDDLENVKIIVMLDKNKENIKNHYLKDYPFADYFIKSNYKDEIKRIKEKY